MLKFLDNNGLIFDGLRRAGYFKRDQYVLSRFCMESSFELLGGKRKRRAGLAGLVNNAGDVPLSPYLFRGTLSGAFANL